MFWILIEWLALFLSAVVGLLTMSSGGEQIRGGEVGKRKDLFLNPETAALWWMAVSSFLFALMNVSARMASQQVHFTVIAASRAWIGTLVAAFILFFRKSSLYVADKKRMLGRAGFGTISMLCTFYVLTDRRMRLGDATTLISLSPLVIAALAPHLLGERSHPKLWFALSISSIGVSFILKPSFLFFTRSPAPLFTEMVAIAAACFAGLAMIMLRGLGSQKKESPDSIAFYFSLFASLCISALASAHIFDLALLTSYASFYLCMGGVAAGLAQICMTKAYSLDKAAKVGSYGYLTLVFSSLFDSVILRQFPSPSSLFGMILVILAGLILR